jgi:hypothetical protein
VGRLAGYEVLVQAALGRIAALIAVGERPRDARSAM